MISWMKLGGRGWRRRGRGGRARVGGGGRARRGRGRSNIRRSSRRYCSLKRLIGSWLSMLLIMLIRN